MLPEIRTNGDIYSIPKFDLDRDDVEGFLDIFKGFHSEFRDCFAREEGRNNFFYYTIGQFSQFLLADQLHKTDIMNEYK